MTVKAATPKHPEPGNNRSVLLFQQRGELKFVEGHGVLLLELGEVGFAVGITRRSPKASLLGEHPSDWRPSLASAFISWNLSRCLNCSRNRLC